VRDINFNNGTISIRRQFTQGRLQELKTDVSRSIIPICEDLASILREWISVSGSLNWVFKGRGDKPYSGENWASQVWPSIKKRFIIPDSFRIHDFRHSYATILIEQGISIEKV
jgi:integrase